MSVECAVVPDHVIAPAHAVENRARASNCTDWESRPQRFAERTDIRLDSVIFLTSTGRVAEPGYDFIEDQQHTVLASEFAQALQVAFSRRDATHVCHDRLGNDRCQFTPILTHCVFQSGDIVPGCQHHVVKGWGWN